MKKNMSWYRDQIIAEIAAKKARDDATPPWLLRLRDYIDAAIDHKLAMAECDEDGYTSSDMAGEQRCENLWVDVANLICAAQKVQTGE